MRSDKDDEEGTLDRLPTLMTVDELATLMRVNRKTIYAMISAEQLPGVRYMGSHIRIVRDVVVSWLRGEARAPAFIKESAMSVRRRTERDPETGAQYEVWLVDVLFQYPDGRRTRIRKRS